MIRWSTLAAIAVAISSPSAPGQELLARALGQAAYDDFGAPIVSGGPDLDGDGFAEIAVGAAIYQSSVGYYAGAAYVLSGRDLSLIHRIDGSHDSDYFGRALAWCDDLDGDGLADLVVGVPGWSQTANGGGSVQIYSSATWTLLRQLDGASSWAAFGGELARLADTDGDGVAELIVGAPGENNGVGTVGTVYVYSGASGALLQTLTVSKTYAFGAAVADVGDVDGDGVNDIGVGAPQTQYPSPNDWNAGAAFVFSGADGSLLHHWYGSTYLFTSYVYGDYLGISIGTAGDVDGDGHPDVWVGEYSGISSTGQKAPAVVTIYSGATGATIQTLVGPDYQSAATTVGDFDGDGVTDFAIGGLFDVNAPIYARDAVLLLSGRDGRELWRGDQPVPFSDFGTALASTQDQNHDGRSELVVGADYDSTIGPYAGRVDLLGSNDLWLDVKRGHFPKAGDTLTLTALEGPPGNLVGLFLTAVHGTPTFSLLQLTTFDSTGQAQWSSTVPKGYAGVSFALRAIAIGPTGKLIESADETIAIQ